LVAADWVAAGLNGGALPFYPFVVDEISADQTKKMPPTVGSTTSASLLMRVALTPPDDAAWSEFVDRYGHRIASWCLAWGLQHADAVDVTQTILTTLVVRLRQFQYDPAKKFRAFLRKMTNDAVCDALRASQRGRVVGTGGSNTVEVLETLAAREDLVQRIEKEFDLDLLEKATERVRLRVAPQTWEAYRLTAEEQLPGAEVASRLGMREGAVYEAKSNVLRLLRQELHELEHGSCALKAN
jgi:RNA polymerase sigma factor (sigma-70 family)